MSIINAPAGATAVNAAADTCQTCRHWHRASANAPGGIALLSASPTGECRESPHLATIAVPVGADRLTGQTRVEVQHHTLYAQTPPDFPACGRYSPKGG